MSDLFTAIAQPIRLLNSHANNSTVFAGAYGRILETVLAVAIGTKLLSWLSVLF